jgi:hypothetical protein
MVKVIVVGVLYRYVISTGMLLVPVCYFRNNISFLVKAIMVTTRSHHINNNQTRNPISVSVNINPITTQNIIMTPTTAATAAATTAATVACTLNLKLNDSDVKAFFKDNDSMNCVTDEAVAALAAEGIKIPEDLTDLGDDDIDNMSRNLTKLATTIRLSAICVKRLKIAAECAR